MEFFKTNVCKLHVRDVSHSQILKHFWKRSIEMIPFSQITRSQLGKDNAQYILWPFA